MLAGNTADVSDVVVESRTAEVAAAASTETVNGFGLNAEAAPGFNNTTWIVPVTADWANFPDETVKDPSVGCTSPQMTWLEAQGVQKPKATAFTFHNESTEGQSLSISDIALKGSVESSATSILVSCSATAGGMGPAQMVFAEVTAGSSSPAIASENQDLLPGADVDYVPGEVIVFNLRPGDAAQMTLEMLAPQEGHTFYGKLVASVSSGDVQQETVLLADLTYAREATNSAMIGIGGGVASCGRHDSIPIFPTFLAGTVFDCVPSSVPTLVENGWDDVASGISGTWVGQVEGDRRSYTLSVTIEGEGEDILARASYPEIPCNGSWTLTSSTSSTLTFIETMPEDVVCHDQVPINLTVGDNVLFYEAESGGYLLTAELRRAGG